MELAKMLVADIPGMQLAKMPQDPTDAPALDQARQLATPVELPSDYAYLGAIEKAKVLETALDQLQKRNSELLTELEHRTQWEAVRLSTALRARASEERERAALKIQEAMNVQHGRFQEAMQRQHQQFEGEMQVHVARATSQKQAEMEEQLNVALEQAAAGAQASEEELAEQIEISMTRKSTAECSGRIEDIQNLAVEIQALKSVVDTDASYKTTSHQVHRVSQAVLSISNQLEKNTPFSAEMAELRQIAAAGDAVISAAVGYVPASASKNGVKTYVQLKESFGLLAPGSRRAGLMPDDAGPIWVPVAYALDFLKFHPKGDVPGGAVEEILARAEYHLDSGNLEQAVKEINLLNGPASQVMDDWSGAAKERLSVEKAMDVVKAHAACLVAQVASS